MHTWAVRTLKGAQSYQPSKREKHLLHLHLVMRKDTAKRHRKYNFCPSVVFSLLLNTGKTHDQLSFLPAKPRTIILATNCAPHFAHKNPLHASLDCTPTRVAYSVTMPIYPRWHQHQCMYHWKRLVTLISRITLGSVVVVVVVDPRCETTWTEL